MSVNESRSMPVADAILMVLVLLGLVVFWNYHYNTCREIHPEAGWFYCITDQ